MSISIFARLRTFRTRQQSDFRDRGRSAGHWIGGLSGVLLVVLLGPGAAFAQSTGAQAPQAEAPAGPPWSARCVAAARQAPLECQMEQRAFVSESGQLLSLVTVRVPSETKKPVMSVQAPLSIFLPTGLVIDIDGASPEKLDFQMCDLNGCYAGSTISDELLQGMFKGDKMNVTFQNLNKQQFKIPMSLSGFTETYNKIK